MAAFVVQALYQATGIRWRGRQLMSKPLEVYLLFPVIFITGNTSLPKQQAVSQAIYMFANKLEAKLQHFHNVEHLS